jgi:hypothetical protein
MNWAKEYESWRSQRARVSAPADFADRVMENIHETRLQTWRVVLRHLAAASVRSRMLRVGVCAGVVAVWVTRLGELMTLLFPATIGY